jgi:septal ring factor EnvC (AmiA/AmiB activator)
MEDNKYLNKAIQEAGKILNQTKAQREQVEKAIPQLKKQIADSGGDLTMITKMENAAKHKDLSALIQLHNKISK